MPQTTMPETVVPDGSEVDPTTAELYAQVEAVLAEVDVAAETGQLHLPESLTNPNLGRDKFQAGNDAGHGRS